MKLQNVLRLLGATLVGAVVLATGELRVTAAGTIAGTVFEDFNGNGSRDTATTIPSSGAGTTRTAVDRGIAGILVSVYDNAGAPQGTATTNAGGAYSISATGAGPYRVEFTSLPAGYRPSAIAGGATGNATTVQFVPDGNTSDVNLGILDAASFCQNNPALITTCFVYGAASGAFSTNPAVIDFPYAAGANSGAAGDYNLPSTHALAVAVSQVGSVYGLGYRPATNTVYAGAYMKKHSGFGTGGTGAIYAINATSGATSLFADLNTIFGAGTAGTDPHDTSNYDTDNGNASWNAVGKISLGGVEVSPDGSELFVMNLANRRVYRLPTSGVLDNTTVDSVSIPLAAPGATGVGGADLRPFALQFYRGQLYVGLVNSAESTGLPADLRAYVYTLDPTTLAFSASPVFQFALNHPRGAVQTFSGTGPGEWNAWVPTFATESPVGVGTYPQPMFTGLTFDVDGNLTLGLRDRAGDQFGFFALDNPAAPGQTWEGVAGGDTLFAALTTPGNLAGGWTLESNAAAGAFGPTAGANNGQGPGPGPGPSAGFGEYFFADDHFGTHQEISGGAVLQLPGFPDVVSSAFDPGLTVRTGGFVWLSESSGAKSKGYNVYDTGFTAPPQPTFSKANGFGELVSICQAAPVEVGNRVWDDLDGDGVQDPNEPGLNGVTVQLLAPGNAVIGTAVTASGGLYYFSSGAGTTTGNAIYNIAGLTANTSGFTVRIANGQVGTRVLTTTDSDASTNGDSRDSDGVAVTGAAQVTFNTGTAGANNHTYDFGYAPPVSLGNFVWYDTNNNGIYESGTEQPIVGVDMVLYRDNGDGVFNATTDTFVATQPTGGTGQYLFAGLTPGNYFVQIPATEFAVGQPLNGYQNSSGQTTGDTNNVDHGAAAPVAGQGIASELVTLTVGGESTVDGDLDANSNLTIDFGFYKLTLGNQVFRDVDNSGTFNAGDTPSVGVTVELMNAAGTVVLATTTTDSGGFYMFMGLTPGDYRVRVTPPTGFTSSTGGGSEPGVDPDNNTDSDDNGTNAGAFIISEPITLTPGGEPTVTNANGETQNMTVDFGLISAPGLSLGNLVWLDSNNNGIADVGEPGLVGVTMRLIAANGTTVLATTTTNAAGLYLFPGLAPGTYFVEVDRTSGAVTGYLSSTDIATSANPDNDVNNDDNGVAVTATTVRSGPVVLTLLGEPINDDDTDSNSNLSVDFGFVRAVSLGNLVWSDVNDNGRVDPGEAGIPGVTLRLISSDGATVLATTTTDATGRYLFAGLLPGSYYVEVVPPPGATSSTDIGSSASPNNDTDNDDNGVNLSGGVVRSGLVTLTLGGEPINDGDTSSDSNLSVDFGFVPAPGGGGGADICLLHTIPSSVAPGGQLSFVYTAVNRGPALASNVMIEGMIPTGTTLVSATPSAGGACTVASGVLDCTWPGLTAAGPSGNRSVTVVLQANPGLPAGTTIWSWFMAGSSSPEPYPSNNLIDSYVFVAGSGATTVDLVLAGTAQAASQSGSEVAARVGQPATARFTVRNAGSVPARGQYVILLDEVGVLEVTGATFSQGGVGVSNATSGTWDTDPIPPGATATLNITVVPRTGTAGKLQLVRINGSPSDPNAANDTAEVTIDAIGPGGERYVAAGNVDGVAGAEIVTGAGAGETPQVRVTTGAGIASPAFFAFDRSFRGGVRVATCDVNADGIDELIAAQGPGGGRVRVLSLSTGLVNELVAFDAFEAGFTGGVNVACGDLDGDGRAEVVVGPAGVRAPDVKVFTVGALTAVSTAQFQAYEPSFTGGVRVSARRFAGSGLVSAFNVATTPGPGRPIEVRVWAVSGATATSVAGAPFFGASTGARVTLADANGDGGLDILLAPDAGTPSLLQVLSLNTGAVLLNAAPGTGGYSSLHAAVGMLAGGPGVPELVIGTGQGMVPTVGTFVLTPTGVVFQRLSVTVIEQP